MKKRDEFEDDGRTIADMSGIVPQPTLLPRRSKRQEPLRQSGGERQEPLQQSDGERHELRQHSGGEQPALTKQERHWAAVGAVRAVLVIAGVYLLGLGALLGILFLLWH